MSEYCLRCLDCKKHCKQLTAEDMVNLEMKGKCVFTPKARVVKKNGCFKETLDRIHPGECRGKNSWGE